MQTKLLLAVADEAVGLHLSECVAQFGDGFTSQTVSSLTETVSVIAAGDIDVVVVDLAFGAYQDSSEVLRAICNALLVNGPGVVALASSSPDDVNAVANALRECNIVVLYRDDLDPKSLESKIRLAQAYRISRPAPDDPTHIAQVLAALRHSEIPRSLGSRIAVGPVEMALTGMHTKLDRVLGEVSAVSMRLRQVENDTKAKEIVLNQLQHTLGRLARKFQRFDTLIHGDTAAKVAPLENRISELERVQLGWLQQAALRSRTLREVCISAAPQVLSAVAAGIWALLIWLIFQMRTGAKP